MFDNLFLFYCFSARRESRREGMWNDISSAVVNLGCNRLISDTGDFPAIWNSL